MELLDSNIGTIRREGDVVGIGDTIKLATKDACKKLGENDLLSVEYEVVQLPEKKKFLMFGGKQAVVFARRKNPARDYAISNLKLILGELSKNPIHVNAFKNRKGAFCSLFGEGLKDVSLENENLWDSIQYIVNVMTSHKFGGNFRIRISPSENFLEDQERLRGVVEEAIEKAKVTGENVYIKGMNTYERRIMHDIVSEHENAYSHSEGEKDNRIFVVTVELE